MLNFLAIERSGPRMSREVSRSSGDDPKPMTLANFASASGQLSMVLMLKGQRYL